MLRQEFLRLCREKYGSKFEYPSLSETVTREVISVICRRHGKVEMIARDHLRTKYGCPHCANENKRIPVEVSNQRYINLSVVKYAGKYDYQNVELDTPRDEKVEIICPVHGSFRMLLRAHFHGDTGCTLCGNDLNLVNRTKYQSLAHAIEAARKVHGSKFEYVDYCTASGRVTLTCPRHGRFRQTLASHLSGRGCRKCGYEDRTLTALDFVAKAKVVHPTGYIYDLSELKTVNDKITITHECGKVYRARVSNHLGGQGCYRCKSSSGEAAIREFLTSNGIAYLEQYKIEGHPYRFDFYLPELNALVEYDGAQHFRPVDFFGGMEGFRRTQERDKDKNFLADAHGYYLIRISYKYQKNIGAYLSRAIDRRFNYCVDNIFYRNMMTLCDALGFSQKTPSSALEHHRTFNVLKLA